MHVPGALLGAARGDDRDRDGVDEPVAEVPGVVRVQRHLAQVADARAHHVEFVRVPSLEVPLAVVQLREEHALAALVLHPQADHAARPRPDLLPRHRRHRVRTQLRPHPLLSVSQSLLSMSNSPIQTALAITCSLLYSLTVMLMLCYAHAHGYYFA